MIELKSLTFNFQNSDTFINDINAKINSGERLAITGNNGSGKTTLLKIISGFLKPNHGSVKIESKKKIIFIPTNLNNFLLPWYSVSQNIAFFTSNGKNLMLENSKEVLDELKFYLADLNGTFLKRKIYKISSGEKAIVSLFSALQMRPDILILDEIFSNINSKIVDLIIKKLISVYRESGVLIFTSHNPTIVEKLATGSIGLREKC